MCAKVELRIKEMLLVGHLGAEVILTLGQT